MESFIEEFITSNDGALVNDELVLERRISPYATLRPGDLAGLLKLHSALPFPGTGHQKQSYSHGNLLGPYSSSLLHPNHKKAVEDAILEEDEAHVLPAEPARTEDQEKVPDDSLTVTCSGEESNHIPAVYTVNGLQTHEMAVVGVYVDKRVCPGFRYRVRRVDTPGRYFFDGEARTLESIGMGYGQRLTFRGPTLNNNECYFWSDSEPNGFAFSVQAVDEGQKFLLLDATEAVVGEAVVEKIHEPQEEVAMSCSKTDGVTKRVAVALTCAVTYYRRHHLGLMDLVTMEGPETLTGEAILHKARGQRNATLKSIDNVFLQRIGRCTFIPDC